MSGSSKAVTARHKSSNIVDGLKSRNDEDRQRAVQELYYIVDRELKEVSIQSYIMCLDQLCNELLSMHASGELHERKGAILAMGCLTEVDFMGVYDHCRQLATQIIQQSSPSDIQFTASEARLMGQFALVFPYDFIDEQIKYACDALTTDSTDVKKQFAILLLRELILNTPSSFYQQFTLFISSILCAFREKNTTTRELAGLTLRDGLKLAAVREQREASQVVSTKTIGLFNDNVASSLRHAPSNDVDSIAASWYSNCVSELLRQSGESSSSQDQKSNWKKLSRDDWINGSILILTELCASVRPKHEELLEELDDMAGLPLFPFLTVHENDAIHSIQLVQSANWSFYHGPTLLASPSSFPTTSVRGGSPSDSAGLPFKPDARMSHSTGQHTPASSSLPHSIVSALCVRALVDRKVELSEHILMWLKSRHASTQVLLLKLLPRFVALFPEQMKQQEFQHAIMDWFTQLVNRDKEKALSLLCASLVSFHCGTNFRSSGWLQKLFTLIRSCLPMPRDATKKRSPILETSAILSTGILVIAFSTSITDLVNQILDQLLATGLNQPLISTCMVIAEHIPGMRKEIKSQILKDISTVLLNSCDNSFAQCHASILKNESSTMNYLPHLPNIPDLLANMAGQASLSTATIHSCSYGKGISTLGSQLSCPTQTVAAVQPVSIASGGGGLSRMIFSSSNKTQLPKIAAGENASSIPNYGGSVALPGCASAATGDTSAAIAVVALALRTLGSFNFEGRPLASFIRHVSDNFISVATCEVKEVRLEAVKTCAFLMLPWLKIMHAQGWNAKSANDTVADILGKLLTVGTSDPDPDVRRCVFESIDSGFDAHLAQAEHLSPLFLALQDEFFDIRCLVMERLGRLSDINHACVQPSLRRVLLHTMNNLALSGCAKNKEHSALLLAVILTSAPRFCVPYTKSMIEVLVPRIRHALPASFRTLLATSRAPKYQSEVCIYDTGHHGYVSPVTSILSEELLVPGAVTVMAPNVPTQPQPSINDMQDITSRLGVVDDQMQSPSKATTTSQWDVKNSAVQTQWMEPTAVVVALFTTLGKLSAVAPIAIRAYMDEFIPILCYMMRDPSCFHRRWIAVWTLSSLITNTGCPAPYRRHPQLLQTLLHLLKTAESKEIRHEVLRALGVLGALDPFKLKLYTNQVDTFGDTGIPVSLHEKDESKEVDITQSELVSLCWEDRSVFFSVCALSALINLLRDSALRSQCANIVQTVVYVLDRLGPRSSNYLRHLIPDYFQCLRSTRDVRLQEVLIRHLGSIMTIVRLHTKEFASEVVNILLSHWWLDGNVQNACINLLSPMSSVLGAEFRSHLTRLIPVILKTLNNESNEVNLITLLEILPEFGYALEDHVHILVPAITALIDITSEANFLVLLNSPVVDKTAHSESAAPTSIGQSSMGPALDLSSFGRGSVHSPKPSLATKLRFQFEGNPDSVGSVQLRQSCLECLARMTDRVDLDDLSGQIVHPICRLLLTLETAHQQLQRISPSHQHLPSSVSHSAFKQIVAQSMQSCLSAFKLLCPAALDVLTGLLLRMGQKFKLLLPLVENTLSILRLRPTRFYTILNRVEKDAYLPPISDTLLTNAASLATVARYKQIAPRIPDPTATITLFNTNGVILERAWRTSRLMSRDDWDQWLRTLTTELLRESPNPAIRACSSLISITPAIGRTLFNAAFVSCWPELTAPQQDSLISKLEEVLLMSDQAPDVSQAILNLEEFMAHVDKYAYASARLPLPVSLRLLADRAMANRAYAKALYYKEQEFLEEVERRSSACQDTLSCLLTIYSKLQLEEAATGVLIYATRKPMNMLTNEEIWREMLQDWKCALNLYENKLKDNRVKDKKPLILGRMRCLRALGQWTPLNTMVTKSWDTVDDSLRVKMAPLACSAAWAIREWDQMDRYVSALPLDHSFDGSFYRAVLDIHRGQYNQACEHIMRARNVLDADLTTMADESYHRAYTDLVCTQLLSEAEEVIQYKLIPERRHILHDSWCSRLNQCQSVVEDWGQILQLRSLVLEPKDDLKTWLRFVGLCRRSHRFTLARQLLHDLLGHDPARFPKNEPIPHSDPAAVFSYTKLLWATGAHEEAVGRLCVLVTQVLEPLLNIDQMVVDPPRPFASILDATDVLDHPDPLGMAIQTNKERQELHKLMAKCCLRLGQWYSDLYVRGPPGNCGSENVYANVNLPPNGLQNSVTVATQFSRTRAAAFSQSTPNRFSLARLAPEIEQQRKQPSTNCVIENSCVNVPQAWDERQGFVIQCYDAATRHAPDNRFAWQSWALTNYAVFKHLEALKAHIERAEVELNKNSNSTHQVSPNASSRHSTPNGSLTPAQTINDLLHAKTNLQLCMELHAAPSVRGFVNSISLSPSANLQDSLRLINLIFKFGHLSEIREVIREGLTKIRLSNWLLVIQQLLARIDTPREHVASIIVDLLITVGQTYPQSMIYPLVLSFKSGGSDRRRYNANRILYSMEEHSPQLVSEAFLLNEELIRLSITWVEMWAEALEDGSRVYFGEKDVIKMFRILQPLHQMLDRGQETVHEATFLQDYGTQLSQCRSFCESYERSFNKLLLQQAWNNYYELYRRFTKHVNNMQQQQQLELCVISPRLHEYRKDWELAVPGSFEPHRCLVRIGGFKNCLTLMTSKQHPRKLTMRGSDGQQYVFLLKGHEDTRQDERVMQFFGLVNTLFMNNAETLRRNLTIQRMSVIPLSTNTGLIGWVPNSDTFHSLIRDYREKTQTLLNKETREMILLAPDFDRLNVIQKTEVFEAGLRQSSGRDLANILWLKSQNSEAWFERRTNFIRSMATMSVVGYILGLGDRHPSNIMLSRETGKVVHIDFGDCFEVAMMREKFPEKVPFRLTRMIIAAMEVTGIDGVYRRTCEMVMHLVRANRESLLAVLEAFIHDPLLQWVLLENRKDFNQADGKFDTTGLPGGAGGIHPPGAAGFPIIPVTALNGGGQHGKPKDVHNPQMRQIQNFGAQTTTASRPTDCSGGLNPANTLHPNLRDYNMHGQPTSHHRRTAYKFIFTNPGYPESPSLRDPYKINAWRHHLCNGPWFGCYETSKGLRKRTEIGQLVVERQGLQAFIFSAKPSADDGSNNDSDNQPTNLGNARARNVMERIRQKLTGTERDTPIDVPLQVDYLIQEATSNENLCQMYIGWCAFW